MLLHDGEALLTRRRGRSALPRNFQYVVLGKKEKDVLANNGIEYYQERIRGSLAADPMF